MESYAQLLAGLIDGVTTMDAHMMTRNVVVGGKRTTIRLESALWGALDEICLRERISRHELCTRVERVRRGVNRAQAVRSAVVNYYRLALKSGAAETNIFDRALVGMELAAA